MKYWNKVCKSGGVLPPLLENWGGGGALLLPPDYVLVGIFVQASSCSKEVSLK